MKTIVYTYKNSKPIFHELDRYYLISSRKEYDSLIDQLLNIDAVSTPFYEDDCISFPVLLELKAGFAPTLIVAHAKDLKTVEKSLKALRKKLKKTGS